MVKVEVMGLEARLVEKGFPGPEVEVRRSVVESILAGIRAADLSTAEILSVVGALQIVVAVESTPGVATGAVHLSVMAMSGLPVLGSMDSVLIETVAPHLVAQTIALLAAEATPELWSLIRRVLEMPEAEVAAMRRGLV